MSSPTEDYTLLGGGGTAALLHRDGLIEWLCWPRFDDHARFAAMLGREENRHWHLLRRSYPTLTIIANALRIADHIKMRLA